MIIVIMMVFIVRVMCRRIHKGWWMLVIEHLLLLLRLRLLLRLLLVLLMMMVLSLVIILAKYLWKSLRSISGIQECLGERIVLDL